MYGVRTLQKASVMNVWSKNVTEGKCDECME